MKPTCRIRRTQRLVILSALSTGLFLSGMALPNNAHGADQANGLTLDPPTGWNRSQEGPNIVYRTDECSLSVLAPRDLSGDRPVPFFQQTWNSVKGALRVLREQPPGPVHTQDGSVGRYASAVVDSGVDERVIAVFMASDTRNAHFMVFTGPVPPCDERMAEVEKSIKTVTLSPHGSTPERL